MSSRRSVSIAFAITLAATVSAANLAAQAPADRFNTIFARYAAPGSPGCAVAMSTPNDTIARGYGLSELEHDVPINSNTIFEAGSISKQVHCGPGRA